MTGMPMPSVLLARRRPGLLNVSSWAAIGWVSAILAASFGTFLLVQLTGGSPNAFNNLGYVSITLAAYRFGMKGGAPAGVLYGLLSGPAAFLVGLAATEAPSSWAVRLGAYIGIGLLFGGLTDALRKSLAAAQTAREHVTRTQTDSMLALARGAEAKDTDTGEHILRVQLVSETLARSIGRPEPGTDRLETSTVWADPGGIESAGPPKLSHRGGTMSDPRAAPHPRLTRMPVGCYGEGPRAGGWRRLSLELEPRSASPGIPGSDAGLP